MIFDSRSMPNLIIAVFYLYIYATIMFFSDIGCKTEGYPLKNAISVITLTCEKLPLIFRWLFLSIHHACLCLCDIYRCNPSVYMKV